MLLSTAWLQCLVPQGLCSQPSSHLTSCISLPLPKDTGLQSPLTSPQPQHHSLPCHTGHSLLSFKCPCLCLSNIHLIKNPVQTQAPPDLLGHSQLLSPVLPWVCGSTSWRTGLGCSPLFSAMRWQIRGLKMPVGFDFTGKKAEKSQIPLLTISIRSNDSSPHRRY